MGERMYANRIRCFKCKKTYPIETVIFECSECGGPLDIEYDYNGIKKTIMKEDFKRQAVKHWKYWMFYPIKDVGNPVTFGEGGTPLISSTTHEGWFFKYEGVNPTGSFKDRGSTVEISKAKELGVREVWCATTGNMGASVAAYSARCGIKANIALPADVPKSKINQILAYGAKVKEVKGTYDDAVAFTKKQREEKGIYLTGDYPYRGEGEKSTGYEIIDQMDFQVPNYIIVPVGNGTNLYGIYKGILELKEVGLINSLPKIVGVQAKGCCPLYRAWKGDGKTITAVKNPKTIANAIEVGNPVDGIKALEAVRKTYGAFEVVTDSEIRKAQTKLGKEGIYAEPAGAAGYAAAEKMRLEGRIVIVVSGHGLKEK